MAETRPKGDFKNTDTIERTYGSAVTEGEVLDFSLESGDLAVAINTLDASVLGTYAIKGKWSIDLDTGITVSQGDKLYFNTTTRKATDVANGNKYLGIASEAQATAGGYVQFFLNEKPGAAIAAVVSGVTTGPVQVKSVTLGAALFDTVQNDLVQMAEGDVIIGWESNMGVAAGAACTFDVGSDVDLDGTTLDVDAFGIDIDANATGFEQHITAGNFGADLAGSPFVAVGTGYVTIQSSTDQSATGVAGTLNIFYIPAGR